MKKLGSKTPGIIALIIGGISLSFFSLSFILALFPYEYEPGQGNAPSFSFWIMAAILSYLSLVPFAVDAILCVIRAFMRYHVKFNVFLALILLGGIPMGLTVGAIGDTFCIISWFLYFTIICVLEVISIVQIVKDSNSEQEEVN